MCDGSIVYGLIFFFFCFFSFVLIRCLVYFFFSLPFFLSLSQFGSFHVVPLFLAARALLRDWPFLFSSFPRVNSPVLRSRTRKHESESKAPTTAGRPTDARESSRTVRRSENCPREWRYCVVVKVSWMYTILARFFVRYIQYEIKTREILQKTCSLLLSSLFLIKINNWIRFPSHLNSLIFYATKMKHFFFWSLLLYYFTFVGYFFFIMFIFKKKSVIHFFFVLFFISFFNWTTTINDRANARAVCW